MLTPTKPTWAITLDNVLDKLKAVVDTYGADHAVNRCIYADEDGTPYCIVGVVLAREGVDVTALPQSAGLSSFRHRGESYPEAERVLSEIVAPDAVGILRAAQIVQDGGNTWGDAYEAAWQCVAEAKNV